MQRNGHLNFHKLISNAFFFLTAGNALIAIVSILNQSYSLHKGWAEAFFIILLFVFATSAVRLQRKKKALNYKTASDLINGAVTKLSSELHMAAPLAVISSKVGDASIKYIGLKPHIVLPTSYEARSQKKGTAQIEPVLAHELAHIKNGDAWRASLLLNIMRGLSWLMAIFIIISGADSIVGFFEYLDMYGLQWLSKALSQHSDILFSQLGKNAPGYIICLLSYTAFLRLREFEADKIAGSLGYATGLADKLRATEANRLWWARFHPSPIDRAKMLQSNHLGRNIDSATIVMVSAVTALSIISLIKITRITHEIYLLPLLGCSSIVLYLVYSVFGYSLGQSLIANAFAKKECVYRILKETLLISLVHILTVSVCVFPLAYTYEAPFLDQMVEIVYRAAALACGIIVAYLTVCLLGMRAYKLGGGDGFAQYVWPAISTIISVPIFSMIMFCLPFTPWGTPKDILFAKFVTIFSPHLGISPPTTADLSRFPNLARIEAFLYLGSLSYLASIFLAFAFSYFIQSLLAKNFPKRNKSIVAGVTIIIFSCGFVGCVCASNSLLKSVNNEFKWKNTLWLRCTDHMTEKHDVHFYDHAMESLKNHFGGIVRAINSSYGSVTISLIDSGCGVPDQVHYPAIRSILSRLFPDFRDGLAELIFTQKTVEVRYSNSINDPSIVLGTYQNKIKGINGPAIPDIVLRAHAPYWYALSKYDKFYPSYGEFMLYLATQSQSLVDRAAALSTAGYGEMWSGHLSTAIGHLRMADSILPNNSLIAANLVEALLRNNECEKVASYLESARWKLSEDSISLILYCGERIAPLDELLSMMWRIRDVHVDDAVFENQLGELAMLLQKTSLAHDYFKMSLSHSDKPLGCSRVNVAMMEPPTMCSKINCNRPFADMTEAETACWKSWAKFYGHSP